MTGVLSSPSPVRVVFVSHVAQLSGAEIGLLRFVAASAGRIEATVVLAEDGPLVAELGKVGACVEVLKLPERARGLTRAEVAEGPRQARAAQDIARYVRLLVGRLKDLQPDLVHTNSLKAGVYGSAAARIAGCPVVWHLHDRVAHDYLPAPLAPVMRALIGTVPNALLVPSQATLATVGRRSRRGLRTAVIPFPIPQPSVVNEVRDPVQFVGMVGRLTPWKGQDVFLRAFADAFGAGDEQAVVIGAALFGEDEFAGSLHALARQLDIEDRVTFTGFRQDIGHELERLDVLVHASLLPDPLTTVVLEGMAAGLPVVSAHAGGHIEYVVADFNGLTFRPGDVAGLSRQLRRVAADHEFRMRMSAQARQTAQQFSGPAVVDQMLDFYRAVITDAS